MNNRATVKLSTLGKVEVVASWKDGVPLAAVRYDLPGLIVNIGFPCGSGGSEDGLEIVINAICLRK